MNVPLFYDARQSVDNVNCYSPSSGKPARFMAEVTRQFPDCTILPVNPVTRDDLYRVHSKTYVDGVFSGEISNGFGGNDPRVPASCLWTVGSLTTAALNAHKFGTPVCSPTSGFHHAFHSDGSGFCTFNGLMVATDIFIEANPGSKVCILDLDWHYGDGVDNILKHKPKLAKQVLNISGGKFFHGGEESYEYLAWLEEELRNIREWKPDLLIYQAGADASKHDPLGGILSDAEMAHRDHMVFSKIKTPTVFNLAGGYQPRHGSSDPVLRLHIYTLKIASTYQRRSK